MTDMGNRVEEGILVGLESDFRPTYTYKINLPHKNAKACSGDVSICEHVGRAVGLELGLGLGLGFFFLVTCLRRLHIVTILPQSHCPIQSHRLAILLR